MGSSICRMDGVIFALLSWLCVSGAAGFNKTNEGEDDREGKANIGIFSVVKFPNDVCAGTNNLNGTCYTASECTTKGGTAAGTCASSFGVCCTFSLACGGTSKENNTYAIINSYSTTSDADPCIYTICPTTTDICKLRIDMETMQIAAPTEYDSSLITAAASLRQHNTMAGACSTDTMTVSNPGKQALPVICGYNTGQHMFVPASSSCNTITLNIDTGTTTTRKWQFKITQYECTSKLIPQEGCLQYFTGLSGQFASFNFDTSATTVSLTGTHLQNQYYSVCWRRERGYCSLCFSVAISAAAAAVTSFGVSASSSATILQSNVDSTCALTAAGTLGPALTDFIDVINLQPGTGTTGTAGRTRICGRIFNAAAIATIATATACTWSAPFKWGVHFDDHELFNNPAAAVPAGQAQENVNPPVLIATQGQGYTGFYMNWFQNKC